MGIFDFFKTDSTPYRNKLKKYYLDNNYPNIPALPTEQESKELIEGGYASMGGLVPKEHMETLENGLLRGHIVMLWWIDQVNRKNVPRYFLFEYGLDFDKEISFLKSEGYIVDSKTLTQKGKEELDSNNQLIREHKAIKVNTIDGGREYVFTDKESVKDVQQFKSSGDFVKDQQLGKAFEQNKDYDNAIKAYKSAISLSGAKSMSPPPNAYYRLAVIYRKLKRRDEEIAILKEGIRKTSSDKVKNHRLVDRLKKLKNK